MDMLLRFPIAHRCYSDKTESICSMLRKTAITNPFKKDQKNINESRSIPCYHRRYSQA